MAGFSFRQRPGHVSTASSSAILGLALVPRASVSAAGASGQVTGGYAASCFYEHALVLFNNRHASRAVKTLTGNLQGSEPF